MTGMTNSRPAAGFPINIAAWPRNSRDIVRIDLNRFKGRFTIEVRVWWKDSGGQFKPSRDGITFGVEHLPHLAEGVVAALRRAEQFGLVETEYRAHSPRKRPRSR
jgi:hypothetical protein